MNDPYQPLEGKYGLTRRCLEVLLQNQFSTGILTKSPLVLRDMDLLERFEEIEVGITVTTEDESGYYDTYIDQVQNEKPVKVPGLYGEASMGTLMGMPVPLVAIHLLWVNLTTDGLPALALAVDPMTRMLWTNHLVTPNRVFLLKMC
jgi:hypothetical protein